jgi:hypothetical protein
MADILCPICREPWDHDELHGPFQGTERARRYRSRIFVQALEKAKNEVRRETRPDAEQLRMLADRANYYANAWTFRIYGCEVFGQMHYGEVQPDTELQARYASTPYPEEWVLD